jgi:hypothetical protein
MKGYTMQNEVKITELKEGVDVHINGDVKLKDIESLTQSCSDGSCGCSPDMLSKIDTIKTKGQDGDVHIALTGKALSVKEIQSCMTGSECDCGF